MKDYLLTQSQGLKFISFPDLKPILKFSNDEIDNVESVDLNEYGKGTFLKSAGSQFKLIELINNEQLIGKFRTVHEFKIPKAVCCACPKTNKFASMAIGLADGKTALTHYELQNKIIELETNRKADSSCSKYLDFNIDNSKLLSVDEGGLIEIFDIPRKQRLFTFKRDKDVPSLAKFKPNTEPHLICVGFNSGKIKMYDTRAQKLVHTSKDRFTHLGLCKDLCFFNKKENSVISVGYDSSVLIHDFRLNTTPIMNFLNDCHINSVVVSADDNYYCLGDDNGTLRVYDMRKSNFTPLSKAKISDRIVKKMIFLQSNVEEFKEDSITAGHNTRKVPQQISSNVDLTDSFYDSFFNMDVPKHDGSLAPPLCANSTRQDIDEVKCENQFIKNIKSRSTCLFEQPKQDKLPNEMPVECNINSNVCEDLHGTSDTIISDITSRIDRYETQLKVMRTKIQGLVSTVGKMNEFIETFPQFIEIEIQNLIRQYREEDMILVEKLAKMCAADPQIVELMEYMMTRHTKKDQS